MSNVDKTISESIKKFSSLINEVAQAAGAAARAEVMAQFSKVLGTTRSQSKAAAVPAEGKRKVGRPRKNPLPEFFAAPSVAKPKQKAKKKRAVSEEARALLANNLKKAKSAKTDKVNPGKRGPGRPRKIVETAAPTVEQAF